MKVLKRFKRRYEFNEFKQKYGLIGTDKWDNFSTVLCRVLSYEPLIEMQEFYSNVLEKPLFAILKEEQGNDFVVEADGDGTVYRYFIVEDPPPFISEVKSHEWANEFYEKYKDSPTEFLELFL